MKNFVQEGNTLDYTNAISADITSGKMFLLVDTVAVACTDIADGKTGAIALEGIFTIPKATSLAIVVGDKLYWDDTNKVLNKTATGNTFAGYAASIAASAATTVNIKLAR